MAWRPAPRWYVGLIRLVQGGGHDALMLVILSLAGALVGVMGIGMIAAQVAGRS